MKIQLLSDLHLEFGGFTPPALDADVVVLAGDIHLKEKGVAWAKEMFSCPVLYVMGNHEYYGGSLGKTREAILKAAEGTNVTVLDRKSIVIDGVRFLGATLWTDYRLTGNQPLALWDAQQAMTDFKKIRDEKFSKLRPTRVLAQHVKDRKFLEESLLEPFDGKTVVVSHHAPSSQSIHPRYKDSGGHLNASYASDLERLVGDGLPALWVHGHTHDSFDYDLYGTRVVCNPRGYAPSELNPGFSPELLIEV